MFKLYFTTTIFLFIDKISIMGLNSMSIITYFERSNCNDYDIKKYVNKKILNHYLQWN